MEKERIREIKREKLKKWQERGEKCERRAQKMLIALNRLDKIPSNFFNFP